MRASTPRFGAAAAAAPIRTTVVGDRIGRFAQSVETTVPFSCLEAVQNAVKQRTA